MDNQSGGYLSPSKETGLLFILAIIQFSHITDFVIMMPLGPQFIRVFNIQPSEFALLVSAYTLSAAFFSLSSAFFLDRYDRKKVLLGVYAGFLIGTGLCGVSQSFYQLLAARTVAGAFGGTVSTVTFAIVGDLVAPERRGRAMGILMAAFSVATVVGLPLGLAIGAHFGWHWVFLSIAFGGVPIAFLAMKVVPPVRKKLPSTVSVWREIGGILVDPGCLRGLAFIAAVMSAGFLVIPFLSPSLVSNVGILETELSFIYLFGGLCTFFTSQLIGLACDRYGHRRVFYFVASVSTIAFFVMTHLPVLPLWIAMGCSAFFMIFVSGRMVPTMAMLTGVVPASRRGSYLSLVTFTQQLFMGIGSFIAGRIVATDVQGKLLHYPRAGWAAIGLTGIALWLASGLRAVQNR